jgi:hypothetical protein
MNAQSLGDEAKPVLSFLAEGKPHSFAGGGPSARSTRVSGFPDLLFSPWLCPPGLEE